MLMMLPPWPCSISAFASCLMQRMARERDADDAVPLLQRIILESARSRDASVVYRDIGAGEAAHGLRNHPFDRRLVRGRRLRRHRHN